MSEGEQVARGAEDLGIFKGAEGLFKKPLPSGVEENLEKGVGRDANGKYPTKEMDPKYKDEEIKGANHWAGLLFQDGG